VNDCPVCRSGAPSFACKALLHPGAELEIHECPECRSGFYLPMPPVSEIARCYPPLYFRDFFKQYWKDYFKGRALALELRAFRKEGALLDVGCALGTLLAGARDHSGWTVAGLEFSPDAAALGRELNGVEIAAGPLSGAPWPEASFDCLHINNVLEHESDPEAALQAAARLLKPGGRLLLTLPNGPVDLLPNKLLYRSWGRAVPTRHGGHLFFFSRRGLGALLERAGFDVLSVRNFHFKLGAKARGWLPGAWKPFQKAPAGPPGPEKRLPLEEYRRLIPSEPSWALYRLGQKWRRLRRSGWADFGYDFEVTARKAGSSRGAAHG
jgi:SAM-dependent methyltransferase